MKYKRISLFLLTAMAVSIVFTGCNGVFHTVMFDSAGGSAVAEQTVKDGDTAVQPDQNKGNSKAGDSRCYAEPE